MAARRSLRYVLGGIGLFLAVGIGVGLVQNFTLGFFIEQLVDPGGNPLDNTLVGIIVVVDVITPFTLGPLVAGGVGLVVGAGYDDREGLGAVLAGIAAGIGFVVMTLVALLLTFAVLEQYSTGGGGGGGNSPFSPSALVPTVIQSGIPMAVVGGLAAYIRARLE